LEQSLEQIIAANLTELRRAKQWTQAELAEKINYSDKSVSKWERGDGMPDIKVLMQLSELFGVTLDFFVKEHTPEAFVAVKPPRDRVGFRVVFELLAVSIVFLVATVLYVLLATYLHTYFWMSFIWAIPVSAFLLMFYNARWNYRVCAIVFRSIFCWSLLTAVYLQTLPLNLWMLFLVGIPAQAAIILWAQIRRKLYDKNAEKRGNKS